MGENVLKLRPHARVQQQEKEENSCATFFHNDLTKPVVFVIAPRVPDRLPVAVDVSAVARQALTRLAGAPVVHALLGGVVRIERLTVEQLPPAFLGAVVQADP